MRQVEKLPSPVRFNDRKQKLLMWVSGLIGVLLAAGLFPVNEFAEFMSFFSDGVTVSKIALSTLIASALAYSAYWIVVEDGV
jgi:hypothetical protein